MAISYKRLRLPFQHIDRIFLKFINKDFKSNAEKERDTSPEHYKTLS